VVRALLARRPRWPDRHALHDDFNPVHSDELQARARVERAKSAAESLRREGGGELEPVIGQLEAALESVKRLSLNERVKCEECGRARIMFAVFERGEGWRLVCPACAAERARRGVVVLLSNRC